MKDIFPKLKRPRFFDGQLLNAKDLETEQQYFINRFRLHNRYLHGYGVVCGLKVQFSNDTSPSIIVTPGLALDPLGNEILVPTPQSMPLPELEFEKEAYLCMRWVECETDFVPALINTLVSQDLPIASAIEEQVTFEYEKSCKASKKRKPCEGAVACGKHQGIALARLYITVGTYGPWKIDKLFRPARVRTGKQPALPPSRLPLLRNQPAEEEVQK